MFKFLSSILSREVLGSKSVSLAFVALVLAVLIAAVAYFIFAFTGGVVAGKTGEVLNFGALSVPLQFLVFVVFLFAFVLIWFLLYIQYNREAEDIYSRLREKLVGDWNIRYELYPNQNRHAPWDKVPSVPCKVAVNEATKKLEILFQIEDDPLFENGFQTIRTISIRHEADNRYSMSYYYKMLCGLNANLSQHLLSETGNEARTELEVEIFASLNFEDPLSRDKISRMSGEWFDLNGNLIRLFSLVSELKEHRSDDKIFKRKLSQAVVTRDNFEASMGEITFFR